MAIYSNREAFIPYRRTDLIELCIEDGKLAGSDVENFREFCSIVSAYYHFQLHSSLEKLKANFAPFDPDVDTKSRVEATPEERANMEAKLVADFQNILDRANYVLLSEASLELAFQEKSLIDLQTSIDFQDFEQMVCYWRGDAEQITSVKKIIKSVEQKVQVFERVALLLKFKDEAYFASKKVKTEKLKFTPGKMYVYLYKNIPKYDLEFLFPNVKTSMTWKDRFLLGVPAIGAAVPLLLKVLPQLLLIIGVILFITLGPEYVKGFVPSEEQVENIMPLLVGVLSLVVTLGGFGFKQYTNYKNKQLKFQKSVTETLFFKNLASNAAVFGSLIDAAEEEECKEIILVYYHLLTYKTPLTPEQLDNLIEAWMEEKFGTKIDFDIKGPLKNLEAIRGKIVKDGAEEASASEVPLLTYDDEGNCQVLSLDEALAVIDYVWDNAFQYTNCSAPDRPLESMGQDLAVMK